MLAARARGLGTCFTTFHLFYEERAARILGIPFRDIMQAGLIPVAYAKRVSFRPAPREPVSSMIHWDNW
jgi:nitroreductase